MNKKLKLEVFALMLVSLTGVSIYWRSFYLQKEHNTAQPTTLDAKLPFVSTEQNTKSDQPTESMRQESSSEDAVLAEPAIVPPIDVYKNRITKKKFGTFVTPQNSPVQTEKFTGYHTGVDVEYEDVTTDVPVKAITDGVVKLSRTATGYGGVMAIEHSIADKTVIVIYGHLRPSSMIAKDVMVKKGMQIAVLGTAYSTETSGERRHLHFAIRNDAVVDIKGYVQNKAELVGWQDPLLIVE